MRPTLLVGLLSVLGALAALPPSALAQDADPAPDPAPPAALEDAPADAPDAAADDGAAPQHITWIDGWEAGRAAARERGSLMLVYVHRTSPP